MTAALLKPGELLLLQALRHTDCIELNPENGATSIAGHPASDASRLYQSKACDATLQRFADPQVGIVALAADGIHWRLTGTGDAVLDAYLAATALTSSPPEEN
jgi:hypothetical protein